MLDFKKDFPLLTNHPETIYLDSAATTQKPSFVIEGVKHYLEHDYANIHRGRYDLSASSEELFWQARKKAAQLINARDDEVIFSSNSTHASNLLVQSLVLSKRVKPGDKVLVSIASHHASLVPRQLVAQVMDIEISYVKLDKNWEIDVEDFQEKYDDRVKVVSLPYVSNVLGQIDQFGEIKNLLREDTYFILDASQAVAHVPIDVHALGCDFLFFTGHKIFALTGIGVLRGKQKHLQALHPSMVGGGAIESVTSKGFTLLDAPDKFEPGTPNLVGAVSLLRAIEYMEHSGELYVKEQGLSTEGGARTSIAARYTAIQHLEAPMIDYALQQFVALSKKGVQLLGTNDPTQKIGLFSFILPEGRSPIELGQYMAKHHICIRCGGQCAQPLHEMLHNQGSCRISFSIYTTEDDVSKFFDAMDSYLAT